MTALSDYQRFVADMSASSYFGNWKRSNPKEYTTWAAYDKALQAGERPAAPVLRTKFGQGMVDGGVSYANADPASPSPPSPVPPTPDPSPPGSRANWPPALQALYDSYRPPAAPTVTVTSASGLKSAFAGLGAGSDVLVKAGSYAGQYDLARRVASGRIAARIRFEPGVRFSAGAGTTACLNINSSSGILLEGPADVSNPAWSNVLVNDCSDLIVRGLVSHDASVQGFYQGGDSGGSANVWFLDCEAFTNGHNSSAWASYPPNYYLAGAHGIYYGGGGSQTSGGGIVDCYIHDQHVGYGVQFYGHTSGALIDGCRFENIDGKVSGADANLQTGTAGDRAGIGIEAWGSGVQKLVIGAANTFSNCVYKNVNVDGGADAKQL